MVDREQRNTDDRTGKYGGDDGAMEHERALIVPGEDPGVTESLSPGELLGQSQAERKQDKDLESGEELPG